MLFKQAWDLHFQAGFNFSFLTFTCLQESTEFSERVLVWIFSFKFIFRFPVFIFYRYQYLTTRLDNKVDRISHWIKGIWYPVFFWNGGATTRIQFKKFCFHKIKINKSFIIFNDLILKSKSNTSSIKLTYILIVW